VQTAFLVGITSRECRTQTSQSFVQRPGLRADRTQLYARGHILRGLFHELANVRQRGSVVPLIHGHLSQCALAAYLVRIDLKSSRFGITSSFHLAGPTLG